MVSVNFYSFNINYFYIIVKNVHNHKNRQTISKSKQINCKFGIKKSILN